MFDIYMETKGNKPDVFGEDYATGTPGGGQYTDYEIPPEALSDERFAAMIAEAEKYLGYPYVWGGSSPSTSFDCSGFVCWVINQSGVGSVGRTTAQGIAMYHHAVSCINPHMANRRTAVISPREKDNVPRLGFAWRNGRGVTA